MSTWAMSARTGSTGLAVRGEPIGAVGSQRLVGLGAGEDAVAVHDRLIGLDRDRARRDLDADVGLDDLFILVQR